MIRRIALSVFFLALLVVYAGADFVNDIKNEYWSWDNGTPGTLTFENYFFSEDGTFRYSWGYSGEKYSGGWYTGAYFYDPVKSKISFNTTGSGTMGVSTKLERSSPKELKIKELAAGMVTIDFNAAHEKPNHHFFDGVMKRNLGRLKEQRWTFSRYSTVCEFYFDPQGNCFYREGKQGQEIDSQYECEYNFIEDAIFISVKNAWLMKMNLKKDDNVKYDPPVKTYIRVNKAEYGEIQVENVDFGGILGGGRIWEYVDGQYKMKNKLPAVKAKDFNTYKIEWQDSDGFLIEQGGLSSES